MSDETLRDNRGHNCVGVVDALSTLKFKRECYRIGDVLGIGRCQLVIGHPRTIAGRGERSKNKEPPQKTPRGAGLARLGRAFKRATPANAPILSRGLAGFDPVETFPRVIRFDV
jgi:hypothetical protein